MYSFPHVRLRHTGPGIGPSDFGRILINNASILYAVSLPNHCMSVTHSFYLAPGKHANTHMQAANKYVGCMWAQCVLRSTDPEGLECDKITRHTSHRIPVGKRSRDIVGISVGRISRQNVSAHEQGPAGGLGVVKTSSNN